MKALCVLGGLLTLLFSSQVKASVPAELWRQLDYKTHQVRCYASPNQVVLEIWRPNGPTMYQSKAGQFYDPNVLKEWVRGASQERVAEYIHVRENIPNIRLVAKGLLILESAASTIVREGPNGAAIIDLADRLCGPAQ